MIKSFKACCWFFTIKLFLSISPVNSVDMNNCNTVSNNQFNKKYIFCDEKEDWYDAANFCNQNGGKLLNIDSTSENDWIYSERQKHDTGSDVWVNLRTTNMVHWHWDNDKHGLINWQLGAPDGFRMVNCARLLPTSKFLNDMNCDVIYDFICEIPTTTTTTTTKTTTTTTPTPTTTPTTTLTTTLTSTLSTNQRDVISNIKSKTDYNISQTHMILIFVLSVLFVFTIGVIIKKRNTYNKNNKKQIDNMMFDDNKYEPFIVDNKLLINENYDTVQPNNLLLNNEPLYKDPLNFNLSTYENEPIYDVNTIQNIFGYMDIEE